MIHLSETDFKELKKLLDFVIPGKEVLAYGSRVSGQPRINSDLDLAVKGASLIEVDQLKNYLSVSPISILVEVNDYDRLPDWIKSQIDQTGQKIQ
jgi:predicted nucleotidyltransferase